MVYLSGRTVGIESPIDIEESRLHDSNGSTQFTGMPKGDWGFTQIRRRRFTRPRTISFHDSCEVFEVMSHKDYTNLEKMLCWYTAAEIDRIWDLKAKIAARMERGEPPTRTMTYRGLECQTLKGERQLAENVSRVITAVMDEQDRQWALGYDHFNAFAQISLSFSPECVRQALYRAILINTPEGDWDKEDEQSTRTSCFSVTFDESFNGIEMFDKCTVAEKKRYWYSEIELDHIFKSNEKDLARIKNGERSRRSLTFRGLEHLTEEGEKSLETNVARVINAVMDEQDRQWFVDKDDPYAFMQVSMSASEVCVKKALKIAKQDEKEAKMQDRELRRRQRSDSQVSRSSEADFEASIGSLESNNVPRASTLSKPPLHTRRSGSSRSSQARSPKSNGMNTDSVPCNSSDEPARSTGIHTATSHQSNSTKADRLRNFVGNKDDARSNPKRASPMDATGNERPENSNQRLSRSMHGSEAIKTSSSKSNKRLSTSMHGSKTDKKSNPKSRPSMYMTGSNVDKNSSRRLSTSTHGSKTEKNSILNKGLSSSMHEKTKTTHSNSAKAVLPPRNSSNTIVTGKKSPNKEINPISQLSLLLQASSNVTGGRGESQKSDDEESSSLTNARRIIQRRRASASNASNADIPQRRESLET